ncbi:MAG TPA: rRNA large subunit methyltransferase I [Chitinophagaceae bacterium]|jgi:23S rRNA (cytosine1962-C5)-methyltransferase|nr:rRNA large subunit methyltransferase I [Chitinophagaceae bacterium]
MNPVILKKNIGLRVENGHPWIFGNEIADTEETIKPGDIVTVYNSHKKFVGKGFINPKSQIAIRLLTRKENEVIDAGFFRNRLEAAWAYRKRIGYTENCRLVFGEADGLPALIIDKFGEHFVIQTLALGMDLWKPAIVGSLQEIFKTEKIYERNDVPVRELEGLVQQKGFLSAPFNTKIIFPENGLQMEADLENGQKTGYFLDQQDNRRAIRHIVKDADVLGAFCYTGSFEVHAGYYGARSVLGLDISENAVAQAQRNARLNGLEENVRFEACNAFDRLKKWSREHRKFDVVMLDPPAFTKSREHIGKAISGYKEINLRGMKLLRSGGFLVSSSCTNLVSPQLFLDTIRAAAKDAGKKIRQVVYQAQSPDHPIVWGLEHTHYLKFLIVEVSD